jgi:hypothetical protein
MIITKICHLADIHLRKATTRNEEYIQVFENLYKSLEEKKPDRIVIVGDLVNEYLDLSPSQILLVSNFLNRLSEIAEVRITKGNHDCLGANRNLIDSIGSIVEILKNPKIIYYNKTGFFYDENVIWSVWNHREKNNNPWKLKEAKTIDKNNYTTIDLFHDPIYGCKTSSGYEMKDKYYYTLNDFKGTISAFGDIHLMQYLNKEKTKAYCGSLISQDHSEGNSNFHGYLLWNIQNKTVEEIPIHNDYSFKTIKITPFVDFDGLKFEIENSTKFMKVRFDWNTLPQTKNNDNERKLVEYIKSKYENIISISHKTSFIVDDKINIKENHTLQNISNKSVQHEIFREYLEKIGTEKKLIDDVITLDEEIFDNSEFVNDFNIQWDVIKFGGKNFMSYENIDVDWRDKSGLFQIFGENTAGKTTIFKILTYILFNKSLETETRIKYGDLRYVNNRNNSNETETYLVLKANEEYYGLKRKTRIVKNGDGIVTSTPTTVNYYLLSTPDDVMDDNTSIENLDDTRRTKTQKKIESIIGSYENFMRICFITSDTMNHILKNTESEFIDTLLYDSGLDIFDKKLENLKIYQKKINEKQRIICNVDVLSVENSTLTQENVNYLVEIKNIETINLPKIQTEIQNNRISVDDFNKKMYRIDPEIYNLNINNINYDISVQNKKINDLRAKNEVLLKNISLLKTTYDEDRLKCLLEDKEKEKQKEYQQRLLIKTIEGEINENQHQIEIINGDVFRLKNQGRECKEEIKRLKESKICPTCGQELTAEHQKHLDENIKIVEVKMYGIADQIKAKENIDKPKYLKIIEEKKTKIVSIQNEITNNSLLFESMLKEIGTLENDKNDVDKYKTLKSEIEQIPLIIQNEQLKIDILNQKIISYNNSLIQIEENKKTEKIIEKIKSEIFVLEQSENIEKENIFKRKTFILNNENKINNNSQSIAAFKAQEYQDMIINLYKKCVHRDGIPRQMLINYIIPRINLNLDEILSASQFKIWLDIEDLRPKLVYKNIPTSIIDCISASGKERTFSSIAIKYALNQINVKSKPSIFILDEVTGKLTEESLDEFNEILKQIKTKMKRILIIEHRANLDPDHMINVFLNENRISSLEIN